MGKKRINGSVASALAEGGLALVPEGSILRRRGRKFESSQLLVVDGPGRKILQFRRRRTIFSEGDPCEHVHYIEQGSVILAITSMTGKQAIVSLLGPGDFFGEGGLAGTKQHLSSASAATDCRVVRIENDWMSQQLNRNRAFSDFFMSYLLTRKARVEANLVDQLFNSSEKRLARALLIMAGYGNDHKPSEEKLPKTSQETLAAMIGTTRSRISHFMNKFREQGYVRYKGGIEVRPSLVNVLLRD